MSLVFVTLDDGRTLECPFGVEVGTLAPRPASPHIPFIAALVNNDVSSLSYPLTVNSHVSFLTMEDSHGWRIYRRSLCFLLAKAVRDVAPDADFSAEHSFGQGLYCSFHPAEDGDEGICKKDLADVEQCMREMIESDIPIVRRKVAYSDAVKAFTDSGQANKLNLLKHRNPPRVVLHCCGDFSDLAHGPLAPSTGVLSRFKLIHYPPGFVLHIPNKTDVLNIPTFEDRPHLFHIFQEHKTWGRILGVNTVGRLNETIASGKVDELIWTSEALHEKKLAGIADKISAARDRIRLVLVAGPSCSGKTTFAKRITTHLTVNGLRPLTLATDDYFVGADRNPLDENGKPDYEHIEAVDLELFNQHLCDLVEGKEIELPSYNFETKCREWTGQNLRLGPEQILIIEGIHGLNPRLTSTVPAEQKFRVYVSALTQLSVDANNRISTTDNRLIRRLVRDHQFRGHSPLFTFQLWPAVRRGEKRWIFPFQNQADATFNSALDYELAVLKPMVEPLLKQIKPANPEYAEARRMSEFLINFLAAPDTAVPGISILREYIGGSKLSY